MDRQSLPAAAMVRIQIQMLRAYGSQWDGGDYRCGRNKYVRLSSRRSPSLQNKPSLRLLHVNSKGMFHFVAPDFNPGT